MLLSHVKKQAKEGGIEPTYSGQLDIKPTIKNLKISKLKLIGTNDFHQLIGIKLMFANAFIRFDDVTIP